MESNIHIRTNGSLDPTTRANAINDVSPTGRDVFNEAGGRPDTVKPIDGRNIMPTELGYGSYFGESNVVYEADGETHIQDAFSYLLPSGETCMIRLTNAEAQIDSIASPKFTANPNPPIHDPLFQMNTVEVTNPQDSISLGVHSVQIRRTGNTHFLTTHAGKLSQRALEAVGLATTKPILPEAGYHVIAETTFNGVKGLQYLNVTVPAEANAAAAAPVIDIAAMDLAYGAPVAGVTYTSVENDRWVVAAAGVDWQWIANRLPGSASFTTSADAPIVNTPLLGTEFTVPAVVTQAGLQDAIDPYIPITDFPSDAYGVMIDLPPTSNGATFAYTSPDIYLWVRDLDTGRLYQVPSGVPTPVVGTRLMYVTNALQGVTSVDITVTPFQLDITVPFDAPKAFVQTTPQANQAVIGGATVDIPGNVTVSKLYITYDWNVMQVITPPVGSVLNPIQFRIYQHDPASAVDGVMVQATRFATVETWTNTQQLNGTQVDWLNTVGLGTEVATTYSQAVGIELHQTPSGQGNTFYKVGYWVAGEARGSFLGQQTTFELMVDGSSMASTTMNFPKRTLTDLSFTIPDPGGDNSFLAASTNFRRWSKAVINNTLYLFQDGATTALAVKSDGSGFTEVVFGETQVAYAGRLNTFNSEVARLAVANNVTEAAILADLAAYNLVAEPPQILTNMLAVKGIFAASGRLGAWEATGSLAWSGSIPPSLADIDLWTAGSPPIVYDFVDPLYGAATTKPTGIKGRIVNILPSADDFFVYCSGSVVRGYPLKDGRVFGFAPLLPNVGVYDYDQVVEGDGGAHYAITSAGLVSISQQGMEVLDAKVSNYLTTSISPVRLRYLNNRYLVLEGEWEKERGAIAGSGYFTPAPIDGRVTDIPPPVNYMIDGLTGAGEYSQDVCGLWEYHGFNSQMERGMKGLDNWYYISATPEVISPVSKILEYSVTSLFSHLSTYGLYVMFTSGGPWSYSAEAVINPCWFKGPTLSYTRFAARQNNSQSYEPSFSLIEMAYQLGGAGRQSPYTVQDYINAYGLGTTTSMKNSLGFQAARNALQNPNAPMMLQNAWGVHNLEAPAWLLDPVVGSTGDSYTMKVNNVDYNFSLGDIMLTAGIPEGVMEASGVALDQQKFLTLESANKAGYSVYNKAMVLDVLTKKWGRCDSPHRLMIDYAPINVGSFDAVTGNRNVKLNYSSFQGSLGGILPDGSMVAYDDKPIDSWVEYGKIGLGINGHTNFHRVQAVCTNPSVGAVKAFGSLDGDSLGSAYSVNSPIAGNPKVMEAVGRAHGKWGSVIVSGWFDIKDLYVKCSKAGVR